MASIWRPPEAFIHGIDGPVVVISARAAAILQQRFNLNRWRKEIRGQNPDLDNALIAICTAALLPCTAVGMDSVPMKELAPDWISTGQAAELLGMTRRGVVAAIDRGRLQAHLVDGRWRIARADVEQYRAERAA